MTEPIKSGATPVEGDGKRILMILGTLKCSSLCHALCDAYTQGARSVGGDDVYLSPVTRADVGG